MKIDDRNVAMALTEKLKASLPIKVRPGKQFLRMLKEKGDFAKELLANQSVKPKKRSSGFGK